MAQPSSPRASLEQYETILNDLSPKIDAGTATQAEKNRYRYVGKKAHLEFEKQSEPEYSTTMEAIRSAAGGVLFNFADELEAGIRTGNFSGPQYEKLVTELRGKKFQFEKENPELALATSIAGSLVVPGGILAAGAKTAGKTLAGKTAQFLSKPAMANQVVAGTGYGALSGAGVAENVEEMPLEIAAGATAGAVGSGIVSGIGAILSPTITRGAKELAKQGVSLTPGQAFGGTIQKLEERLIPATFGEAQFLARRLENTQKFNVAAANNAFREIGERIPDDATPETLIEAGQDLVKNMYDKVYKGFEVKLTPKAHQEFSAVTNQILSQGNFGDQSKAFVKRKEIFMQTLDLVEQGVMPYGQAKTAFVTNNIKPLMTAGKEAKDRKLAEGLTELVKKSEAILGNQQTNRNVMAELKIANRTFAKWSRITDAMGRNKSGQNVFSPDDLLAVIRKGKPGGSELKEFAEMAKPILSGSGMRSSGTGERVAQTDLAKNIVKELASKGSQIGLGGVAAGGPGAVTAAIAPVAGYSSVAQKAFNKLINPGQSRSVLGELLKLSAGGVGAATADASPGAPDSVFDKTFPGNPLSRLIR
tara:strand:+ start:2316 stop:4085 length:1770 start_codon:yes stop_codon:yes gene_type:complete